MNRNAEAVEYLQNFLMLAPDHANALADLGIIFCGFSEAVRKHPELVKKYLGTVVPYSDNFFATLNSAVFTDGWGTTRWGDTIDVIYWLYNRTGDDSLLNLVTRIHQNSANWVNNLASLHNVNFAQGFREPAQFWTLSGDSTHRDGSCRSLLWGRWCASRSRCR